MRVGDFIYATYKGHRIVGKIVYGYSPKMHEFTDQEGRTVDRREVIGVMLAQETDAPIVRMEGGQWAFHPLENEPVVEVPPEEPEPKPTVRQPNVPSDGKKKRKQLVAAYRKWIRPLRVKRV